MCTVKIQFVLWVAMETVIFYIAKMSFFLKTFFSLIKLVQVNKLIPMTNCPWGCKIG